MSNQNVQVIYEATPNPQAMKFIVDRQISESSASFSHADQSLRSPLARKLFGFPWAAGVFIGNNFVTVTKQDWVDWKVLADPLSDLVAEHINRGEPVLLPETSAQVASSDSPTVNLIKQILDLEIRPAVAMDGGDIVFDRYEDGVVYLYMQGSCSGCPSATMTLKEGIETRLKASVPEIKEVLAL